MYILLDDNHARNCTSFSSFCLVIDKIIEGGASVRVRGTCTSVNLNHVDPVTLEVLKRSWDIWMGLRPSWHVIENHLMQGTIMTSPVKNDRITKEDPAWIWGAVWCNYTMRCIINNHSFMKQTIKGRTVKQRGQWLLKSQRPFSHTMQLHSSNKTTSIPKIINNSTINLIHFSGPC